MNKVAKIVLTAIASLWSLILLVIGFAGNDTDSTKPVETTTQAIVEESTTHGGALDETTEQVTEESTTVQTTEQTTEETTTKPTTTKKETTTRKVTTTKQATTKKETTTAKSTTTKKVTTTAKPTTTKRVTTTDRDSGITVYRTKSGEKYHYENPCGNGTYYPISLSEAKRLGLDACEKCVLH